MQLQVAMLLLLGAPYAWAQPAFEVASVKPSNGGVRQSSFELVPGGERLTVRNMYLGLIVQRAYGLDELQFARPTPPLLREPYDIDAEAEHPASRAEMMRMLRALLEDRFQLRLHRESKEVTGYALVR